MVPKMSHNSNWNSHLSVPKLSPSMIPISVNGTTIYIVLRVEMRVLSGTVSSIPLPKSKQTSNFIDFISQISLEFIHFSATLQHYLRSVYSNIIKSLPQQPSNWSLILSFFLPKHFPYGIQTNLVMSLCVKTFNSAPVFEGLHRVASAFPDLS